MKSSGCLYGLSGQGVHFLYQSQLLPAFLTVCNAVDIGSGDWSRPVQLRNVKHEMTGHMGWMADTCN